MKKEAIIILIFIISLSSAYQLGLSPTQLEFNSSINKEICQNISLFSKDYKGAIQVRDKWAPEGIKEKSLAIHNLSSKSLNITLSYPEQFSLSTQKQISVCLTAQTAGFFHGLILFQTQSANIEVGSWLLANISGNVSLSNPPALTTLATQNSKTNSKNSLASAILISNLILTPLLLLSLLTLLIKAKNRHTII